MPPSNAISKDTPIGTSADGSDLVRPNFYSLSFEEIVAWHNESLTLHPTRATHLVSDHLGFNPKRWTVAAWEWLFNHPTHAGYYLWEVTRDLYEKQRITLSQMKDAMDVVWSFHASSTDEKPQMLMILVKTTNPKNIQMLQHIAQKHTESYTQMFKKINRDMSLNVGCDCILHAIDENTDLLLAQSPLSTPKLEQWRTELQLAKTLKEHVAQAPPPITKHKIL